MFQNNLKIALRNFRKHRFYGLLNLSGLVVGLAACWLMLLFVQHELGFDRFFDKADRIYQVNLSGTMGEQSIVTSNTPPPVGATMQAEFPEVQAYTRLLGLLDGEVKAETSGQVFVETNMTAVDSTFLDIFNFPLLTGDRKTCLTQPGTVVLTEPIARKYFGDGPALGKTLIINDIPRTVTGVLAALPSQSSLQFDMLLPIHAVGAVQNFSWSWVWLQLDTYVLLKEKMEAGQLAALNQKFPAMVRKNAAAAFERIGQPLEPFLAKGGKWDFSLKPLKKVHLYSAGIPGHIGNLGNIRDVYVFGMVGLFILLLACVNFMNLSTARSLGRAKEVGVRKVLGSERGMLVRQFLSESMLYGLTAAVLAAVLAQMALPFFNLLTGESLTLGDLFSGWTGILALALPVLAGFLGGIYPALFLSGFKPLAVLNGGGHSTMKGSGGVGNVLLRNGLVVFQFSISVALVICTMVVIQQISFSKTRPLGLQKENVLLISNAQRLENKVEAFRQQLLQQPNVLAATHSTDAPATGGAFGDFYVPEPESGNTNIVKDLNLNSYMVDDDFVPTLGIGMAQGRNFSLKQFPSDSAGVIINEAAVKLIGWKDPIGRWMTYPGGGNTRYQVVGVMKDFNIESLRAAIEPFALFHQSSKSYQLPTSLLAVRLRPGEEKAALAAMETRWKAAVPNAPFDYSFMDEKFDSLYRSEEKLGAVLGSFTALSIFIACLGLFGLIAFAAERRTKEIGIRKVLGATTGGIVGLLSKDFLLLVVIALVFAYPIAYFFMHKWLQDFAYRIDIHWTVFVLAGLAAVVGATFTVALQAVKAALANPVKSLRSE
jgi:putative ABC transport system permease protein